ncbi:SHOCT domain-containing protein [Streptomyces microflavus]|uniref:SHOCT domain-containing protein n=1 Tax=Streptomyces microflavus TaxID=1919 RepID=UPI003801A03C
MPGLLRGVARTAVIAGTATSVSNRVSRRQQGRWAEQQGSAGPTPQSASYAEPAPAPARTDTSSKIEQLKQLGELKAQGILTESEFEAQKRMILGP